jgi:magnesium-transporting ATPase (P-type)
MLNFYVYLIASIGLLFGLFCYFLRYFVLKIRKKTACFIGPIRGYRRDFFGQALEYFSILYFLSVYMWLSLIIASQYGTVGLTYAGPDMFLIAWTFVAGAFIAWRTILRSSPMMFYWPVSLNEAEFLFFLRARAMRRVSVMADGKTRICEFRLLRYVYDETFSNFRVYSRWSQNDGPTVAELKILIEKEGLSLEQAENTGYGSGPNRTGFAIKSIPKMLIAEYLTDFSAFQILSLQFSGYWDYLDYSTVMSIMIFLVNFYNVIVKKRRRQELNRLCEYSTRVRCMRDKKWRILSSDDLVPGDYVKLEAGGQMTFDGILVNRPTIADESSLTGNPVPVHKQGLKSLSRKPDTEILDRETYKDHYVFAGTELAHIGTDRIAIVTHTGSSTIKGKTLQRLIYGKTRTAVTIFPARLLWVFLGFGLIVFTMVLSTNGITSYSVIVGASLITVIVNPLLSLAVLGGLLVGMHRLKSKKISVSEIAKLEGCGRINTVCFDKLGTLTENRLTFSKSLLCIAKPKHALLRRKSSVMFGNESTTSPVSPASPSGLGEFPLAEFNYSPEALLDLGLAVTHSTVRVRGNLVGDALEIEMIREVTRRGWDTNNLSAVLSRDEETLWYVNTVFNYSSLNQTLSVIVSTDDDDIFVFCKGSFDAVRKLCKFSESSHFDVVEETVKKYAAKGNYVLAIAVKPSSQIEMKREEAECDFLFLGLYLFKNRLKEESMHQISRLKQIPEIDIKLITTDSCRSSIATAREVGLIEEKADCMIALPLGVREHFDLGHDQGMVLAAQGHDAVVSLGLEESLKLQVIGSLLPGDKLSYLKFLQDQGKKKVLFTGDSCNEVEALTVADSGLSLNGTSNGLVAAPFSTNSSSLGSLVDLIEISTCSVHATSSALRFLVTASILDSLTQAFGASGFGLSYSGSFYILTDLVAIPLLTAATWFAPVDCWSKIPRENADLLIYPIMFSVLLSLSSITYLYIRMYFFQTSWFVSAPKPSNTFDWSTLGNSYESQVLIFWLFWSIMDCGRCNGGHQWWKNQIMNILTLAGYIFLTVLLFSSPSSFTCQYKFSCNAELYSLVGDSTGVNALLFALERSGGEWDGALHDTEIPLSFKLEIFITLFVFSFFHRFGYYFILKRKFKQIR